MEVTVFIFEPPVWNGSGFDLGPGEEFLRTQKDHPALFAYLLIDEPYHQKHNWEITTERMQRLYQQAKSLAPNVPMQVGWSREIWRSAQGDYGADYAFEGKMCDICAVSTLEFRNYGPGNSFDRDTAVANHRTSRELILRENPEAEIWATVQVFGSVATTEGRADGSTYYMPSAAELQEMIDLLFSPELQAAGELDGVYWQQWASFRTQQEPSQYTLADPEFADLRAIVEQTTAGLLGLS
jgi:hypothetical protein